MSDGYVIGLDVALNSFNSFNSFTSVNSASNGNFYNFNYTPSGLDWAITTSAPAATQNIQSLNFDLTPAGNASFKLTVSITNNKVNSFSIAEHVQSLCVKERILQTYVVGGKLNQFDKCEWTIYNINLFTDLVKKLMEEAEEIILRLKNIEIFC